MTLGVRDINGWPGTVSQRRPDMSDTAPQDDYASHTIGGDEDATGFSAVVGLVGGLKQLEDNLYRGIAGLRPVRVSAGPLPQDISQRRHRV